MVELQTEPIDDVSDSTELQFSIILIEKSWTQDGSMQSIIHDFIHVLPIA